jgi:hypothetical protein
MPFLAFGNNDLQGFLIGKGNIRLVIDVFVIPPKKILIEKGHIDAAFRSIGKKFALSRFGQAGYFGPKFDVRILGPLEPFGHPGGNLFRVLFYKANNRLDLYVGRIVFIRIGY